MSGPHHFLPGAQGRPVLARNAAAPELLARVLDALLVLDVEGSAPVTALARRVGLAPEHLRELLSAYMVASADVLDPASVPFSIVFGTATGPVGADEEDDEAQGGADHVWMDDARSEQVSLLSDVGQRPVGVEEVVVGLLRARQMLDGTEVPERLQPLLAALEDKLSAAMSATVAPTSGEHEGRLAAAVARRQRVRVVYRDPWTGTPVEEEIEPYELYVRSDHRMLAGGTAGLDTFHTYEVSGVERVDVVSGRDAFTVPDLPAVQARHGTQEVVVRVPSGSGALTRLLRSWGGSVEAEDVEAGHVDVRVAVDRPAAQRVGVLVLQLGDGCSVVAPAELADAPVEVAWRVLAAHQAR